MDGFDVVRRLLIYVVVQPVGEEEVGVGSPGDDGTEIGVVGAVVVAWNVDGQTLAEVAAVLRVEGQGRVLGMAGQYMSSDPYWSAVCRTILT